jgi:hypothetical protein
MRPFADSRLFSAGSSSTTYFAINDVNIPAQHIPVCVWRIHKGKVAIGREISEGGCNWRHWKRPKQSPWTTASSSDI